jgi:hypothetical protein
LEGTGGRSESQKVAQADGGSMSEETKPTPTTGFFNKKLLMSTYRMSEDVADMIIDAVNQSDHVKIIVKQLETMLKYLETPGGDFNWTNWKHETEDALADYRRATEGK